MEWNVSLLIVSLRMNAHSARFIEIFSLYLMQRIASLSLALALPTLPRGLRSRVLLLRHLTQKESAQILPTRSAIIAAVNFPL